jgi:hypothetical protein
MKNIYLLILLFIGVAASAQSPDKMSYQAVLRDANGEILKNQIITIQFSLIKPTSPGAPVYQEFHRPTTNSNGLISVHIGTGTINLGDISKIDWSKGPYFLKTEIDITGGFNYSVTSNTEIVSVPYSLYATKADSLVGGINETDPVFDTSIAKGITASDTIYWNSKLDSYSETDPVFGASIAKGITASDATYWNNKLDSSSIQNFVDLTSNQKVGGDKRFRSDLTVNGITIGRGRSGDSTSTANGFQALYKNNTGGYNTANGSRALFNNNNGGYNSANGYEALRENTSGRCNTANGSRALHFNTRGYGNTANGYEALYKNTSGIYNNANGQNALYNNTDGQNNTANGRGALFTNTIGNENTALGNYADLSAPGFKNATAIGHQATASNNDRVKIGNTSITRIGGQVGWTNISDGRIKENVQEAVPGLSFISELRPVTYTLNTKKQDEITMQAMPDSIKEKRMLSDEEYLESSSIVRTGFIAQEVEAAAQKVGFDFDGVSAPENETDLYGIRYAEFVVPLVKAVQEQQEMIDKQRATIEQQRKDYLLLLERVEELERE